VNSAVNDVRPRLAAMAVATEDARPREGTTAPRSGRLLQLTLLLVPIVFLLVMGWRHRWIEEDAFLNFRVVDQIRVGHGPVFNVGERVEIFTSTLWLAMLTAARSALPNVSIEYLSIAGGLLLTGLGLWWAERGAAVLWRSDSESSLRSSPSALLVPFGVVVVVALPASWDWATSGLENGLSLAWLGALMLVVATVTRPRALPMSGPRALAVGALLGLGPLVRPDLAVVSVVVVVAVLWSRRPRGAELVWLVAGFFALPVGYEIFRAGYYGALVPNTALAKDSGGMYWSQGWNYLVDLVAPYWLWVPMIAIVVATVLIARAKTPRPELVPMLALPVGGILHVLFIVESGGDYLHARLLMPSLFAIVAPFAVIPWRRQFRLPLAAVGIWALVAIAFLRPNLHQQLVPVTDYGVADGRALMSDFTRPGHRPVLATDFIFDDGVRAKRLEERGARALVTTAGVLPDVTPERTTLVTPATGISGYRAGPEVLVQEVNSLGDPVGSRMPTNPMSHPGHRKRESWPWILALTTRDGAEDGLDVSDLERSEFPSPPLEPGEVAAARHALRCGALAKLRDATRDPLTVDRFWSNLTGAIGRTRLEVPRDPFAAERKFCGP
jgi:arabinofuranosyltransferase